MEGKYWSWLAEAGWGEVDEFAGYCMYSSDQRTWDTSWAELVAAGAFGGSGLGLNRMLMRPVSLQSAQAEKRRINPDRRDRLDQMGIEVVVGGDLALGRPCLDAPPPELLTYQIRDCEDYHLT